MGVADSEQARDLIKRARAIREAAGIPIGTMAGEVGCDKSTLSVWERDPPAELGRLPKTRPMARRWLAVLHLLDVTSSGDATAPAAQAGDAARADR